MAFYAYSGISNLIFIAITGFSVFVGGIWLVRFSKQYQEIRKDKSIDRARRKEIKAAFDRKRKIILWTIIVINFGMLAVLKYLHPLFEGFLIPLGISFYMFISIGYLVDIYFEKYEAEKNPFRFLLFVSFFPQLIQGPINRYDQMKEQLYGRHTLDWYRCKRALILILFGLLKKYAIANLLVHEIANILDAPTEKTPGSVIVFAILLYSAQQYADFSGGIDIVMGVAKFQTTVFFCFTGGFLAKMAYFAWCMDERLCILSICADCSYAEIRKMGEKASERSFRPCTSGIHCEYSGIFPCRYLAWRTVALYLLGSLQWYCNCSFRYLCTFVCKNGRKTAHKCKE